MTPTLLTDKSRLQEIYDLRVVAYEHSPKAMYVNKQTFPKGWYDELDEREQTLHWIIEENQKIIASARLAILDDIRDTNEEFDKFNLPIERPFAYWSRLVVHPEHRRTGAMMLLDAVRKAYLANNPYIHFALCCVTEDRSKVIERLGFNYLGEFMYNWNGPQQLISAYMLNQSAQRMYIKINKNG
jgi:predicted GNAT family N-acyltransferase